MRILVSMLTVLVLPGVLLTPGRAADDRTPAGRFDVHGTCALCHDETRRGSAMRDAADRNVAPVDLWRSSAMANASRDPVWRAVVAIEAAATPSRAGEIEALCLRCHAPMAPTPSRLADLEGHGRSAELARDGVSCTVCHGILAEGLGTPASMSGGWAVDDDGRLFGPHARPFDRPMRHHTDFVPVASAHILEPALCGTCHTLLTRAVTEDEKDTSATLPEQVPYLEWRNSVYSTERSGPRPEAATCRDCHLPTEDLDGDAIRTLIAHNPGGRNFPPTSARAPFGRHVLVGANDLLPRLLRGHAPAPAAAFDETLARVEEQVRQAARLSVEHRVREKDTLEVEVAIENLAGHRLPTAHPTRRVWLVLEVLDDEGDVVFASGAFDAGGRIVGKEGEPLPSETAGGPLPDHVSVITSPDQVALYDARMEDAEGRPTWLLTRGARFAKDNRLLPKGWQADGPHAELTRPVGVGGDDDFVAGGDVVRYRVTLDGLATAPGTTVRVRLVHQTIGARWVNELAALDLKPSKTWAALLDRADLRPSEMAHVEVRVGSAD